MPNGEEKTTKGKSHHCEPYLAKKPAANAIGSKLPCRHGPNTTFLPLVVLQQDPKI